MHRRIADDKGVTLVSLMVGMAIASIVMATIYGLFVTQTATQRSQQLTTDMMQNLRAGLYHMERDIRIAGYDPQNDAGAGFTITKLSEIEFAAPEINKDS